MPTVPLRKKRVAHHPLRSARRLAAGLRQDAAAKRTPREQYDRLDDRLAPGRGATKERSRLLQAMMY